jgi:stalled ribosome rescue protein Dom34
MMPRRGRRGYPTAILIGLSEKKATFWTIYSESVKPSKEIERNGVDEKSANKFHESIVENIRNLIKEGFTGVIITSEERTNYESRLTDYIIKHHKWLKAKVPMRHLIGKAGTKIEVIQLIKENKIQEALKYVTEDTEVKLLNLLDKAIVEDTVLYTIEELYSALNSDKNIIAIFVTEEFNLRNQRNRRYQSIMQIARNLGANVTILKQDTPISTRLDQLGGFACVISLKS